MKTAYAIPSVENTLVATLVTRPGINRITILPLSDDSRFNQLSSNIDFQNGETVSTFKWIKLNKDKKNSTNKKRRNSSDGSNISGNESESETGLDDLEYIDYLAILLTTGEILIYSTFTKEFINKITSDTPFSSMELINEGNDLITFDAIDKSLKIFNTFSPQLIDSISFKHDILINYILCDNLNNLIILASDSKLFLLDNTYNLIQIFDISIDSNENSNKILKIINQDLNLYIIRSNCNKIQKIDLNKFKKAKTNNNVKSKKLKSKIFTTTENIQDISLIKSNNDLIISTTLTDGSIELFNLNSQSVDSFAKLEIEGGDEVGIFINLLNSNNVIEGVYKGIWYDNFNVQITDFEFENILNLNGSNKISVSELADPNNNDILEFNDKIEEEGEGEGEQPIDEDGELIVMDIEEDKDVIMDDDNNSNKQTKNKNKNKNDKDIEILDYKCSELPEFVELIKPKLLADISTSNEEFDQSFILLLSQNIQFAKSCIYILSIEESNQLFVKISNILLQSSDKEIPNTKNGVKEWFKWLLILRGNLISRNTESIEWLKILQSNMRQDSLKLTDLIKLTGKLSLLKDQLLMRNEIMKKNDDNDESESEEDDELNETTLGEDGTSVVLDGEGGFDEDEDDEKDVEDEDEDDDEQAEEEGEEEGEEGSDNDE